MKLNNILAVYTIPRNKDQKSALDTVERILKKYSISYKLANRDRLAKKHFEGKDLIIAVGGDGTFLRAAHFIGKQPVFGVNADLKNKEGFFMKADKKNFEQKLEKIIKNRFKIVKLPRLEAYINNRKAWTMALNEFFIGPLKSYHAAKYLIEQNGKKERQKSSGVLVTTAAGSYAWASACCSRRLPLNSSKYQFVVREPYEGKVFKNYKLKYGILNKNQKISIISEMLDGILVADSVGKEFKLKLGDRITVRMSRNRLNFINF